MKCCYCNKLANKVQTQMQAAHRRQDRATQGKLYLNKAERYIHQELQNKPRVSPLSNKSKVQNQWKLKDQKSETFQQGRYRRRHRLPSWGKTWGRTKTIYRHQLQVEWRRKRTGEEKEQIFKIKWKTGIITVHGNIMIFCKKCSAHYLTQQLKTATRRLCAFCLVPCFIFCL